MRVQSLLESIEKLYIKAINTNNNNNNNNNNNENKNKIPSIPSDRVFNFRPDRIRNRRTHRGNNCHVHLSDVPAV